MSSRPTVKEVARNFSEYIDRVQRMPGYPNHFSRERASRRTSAEGRGVTSPLSISR